MFKNKLTLEEALKNNVFEPLEYFDNPLTSPNNIVRIIFPEFTCHCPKTGYPDFASIGLFYQPKDKCVELKSWKLYLNSFRDVGTFHEAVTQHIFTTLKDFLDPKWICVAGDFFPRGNVDTTVVIEEGVRPNGADLLMSKLVEHCRGFNR